MDIIDLSEETKQEYCCCLEEWSEEMRDGVRRKECWIDSMRDKLGLRVKLARNDQGITAGMIHYAPIEYSWAEGDNLYFVYCIWVHGHKNGRGDMRKQGAGSALLKSAEEDVKSLGGNGLVLWGLSIPIFMPAGWFKKHGYRKVDRNGISLLLWKPFNKDAAPPHWIKEKKTPESKPGVVTVTALNHGWCTGTDGMIERARAVCDEYGDKVSYREIDTSRKDAVYEWGLTDALFVDSKNIYRGPPLTEIQIRKAIDKKVRKLI